MKLKISFVSAAVFILLLTCESYPQTFQHYNFKLKENSGIFNDSQKTQLTEKKPFAAGVLSFILPGLGAGQLYNEQNGKFIRHIGISAGLIVFTILAFEFDWMQIDFGGSHENQGIFFAVAGLYIGNWVWSIIDAVNSANEINKQAELQKYHSDLLNRLRFGLTYDKNKNLNLKFSVRL